MSHGILPVRRVPLMGPRALAPVVPEPRSARCRDATLAVCFRGLVPNVQIDLRRRWIPAPPQRDAANNARGTPPADGSIEARGIAILQNTVSYTVLSESIHLINW